MNSLAEQNEDDIQTFTVPKGPTKDEKCFANFFNKPRGILPRDGAVCVAPPSNGLTTTFRSQI